MLLILRPIAAVTCLCFILAQANQAIADLDFSGEIAPVKKKRQVIPAVGSEAKMKPMQQAQKPFESDIGSNLEARMLIKRLEDEDENWHFSDVKCLDYIGSPEALIPLLGILLISTEEELSNATIEAIFTIEYKNPGTLDTVIPDALLQKWIGENKCIKVQERILELAEEEKAQTLFGDLWQSVAKNVVKNLNERLNDKDHKVRGMSALHLSHLGRYAEKSLPKLEELSNADPELGVRYIAQDAYEQIQEAVQKAKPLSFWETVFDVISAPFRFALGVIKFAWRFNYAGFIGIIYGFAKGGTPYLGPNETIVFVIPGDDFKATNRAFTTGNVIIMYCNKDSEIHGRILPHELGHVEQGTILGPLLPIVYGLFVPYYGDNVFFGGGYNHPFEKQLIEKEVAIKVIIGGYYKFISLKKLTERGYLKKLW